MLLREDVETMITERDLDHQTELNYRRSVRCFSAHLGRPATRDDLREAKVNAWLKSLDLAPQTIRHRKQGITGLWNWLAQSKVSFRSTTAVACVESKCPKPVVRAWTIEQIRILISASEKIDGQLSNGIDGSKYMKAAVLFGYDVGLRPTDLRLITWHSIDGRRVLFDQRKTGYGHVGQISEATLQALIRIKYPKRERPFHLSKGGMRRWEKRLYSEAKALGFVRYKGQGFGTLRKSHATEIARRDGVAAAAKSLGHVSGITIALTHYIEPDAISNPYSTAGADRWAIFVWESSQSCLLTWSSAMFFGKLRDKLLFSLGTP